MPLLFYNRAEGKGEFYNVQDAQGNLQLLGSHTGWRTTWTHIVDCSNPSLLFYDSNSGAAEFYTLDLNANMQLLSSTTFSKGWTHIVLVGTSEGPGFGQLLFYNANSGVAQFYGSCALRGLSACLPWTLCGLTGHDTVSSMILGEKRVLLTQSEGVMDGTCLLSLPEGMQIDQIQISENGLIISVVATTPTSCCPLCCEPSSSIHCHYRRTLRDAPCAGRQVQLVLTVRKFSCRNLYCERKVFAERLPSFVEPWARATIRYCQQITSIGLATCGKGGARLASRLGIRTSRDSILRRVMDLPDRTTGSVLYLGIDDFSFRRGQWFGTILVDLESHRPVDLLPDRQATTLAQWMRQHPEITVVSRDRGSEYASAATQGAPQAIQCADRFHVVKNLTEATQLLLAHCQAEIAAASTAEEPSESDQKPQVISVEEWRPPEPAHVKKVRLTRRAGRYERYQQVIQLHEQGLKPKQIAQQLDRK